MARRAAFLLWLAMCVVALLPLWWFDVPPSADLPNHVAISAILARIMGGTPDPHYAVAIPHVPYHLAYVLLAPLVGLLGPLLGQRVFLTLLGAGTLGATHLVLRALGRPQLAALGGLFLFYSALFFWGFVSTAVGIPIAFVGYWCLLRHDATRRARYLVGAAAAALCTCAAHVLLVPLWLALVAAYVALNARKNVRVGVCLALAACAPALPAVIAALTAESAAETCVALFYQSPSAVLHHVKRQFSVFGKGLGRAGHLAFIALVLAGAVFSRLRRAPSDASAARATRSGVFLLAAGIGLMFVAPVAVDAGSHSAWGVNFRYFAVAELGALMLYPALSRSTSRWLAGGVLFATAAFLAGLWLFWARFDRSVAPARALLANVPPGRTLSRLVQDPFFENAWPPLRAHLPALYVAEKGGFDQGLFAGGHVPLRALVHLRAQTDPSARLALTDFDLMLVEGELPDHLAPLDGKVAARVDDWTLFTNCGDECAGEKPRAEARAPSAVPYWQPGLQKQRHDAAVEARPQAAPVGHDQQTSEPTLSFCF